MNIFLADDHQIVIDGLTLLLKNEPDINIIGWAISGVKAQEDIMQLKPDLVLIDLRMPDKDGLQILQALKMKVSAKFIILSMHHDKRFINDARNYGADGYLFKNTGRVELLETIRKVSNGEQCFPIQLEAVEQRGGRIFLTPREMDIFKLVINGSSSAQIAARLSISEYTVETHRKSIVKKTGAKNLIGLVKYAIANNISFDE